MQKSTYILINVFLLIFWMLMALISPSYITSIGKEQMSIDHINLNSFHGRRSGVYFEYNNNRYFAYCRNFMNENMENFCDKKFPIKNAKAEFELSLSGLYKNSENIVIIKYLKWKGADGSVNEFKLSDSEYLNAVNYLRYNNYFIKIILIISFIAVFYFYKRKN